VSGSPRFVEPWTRASFDVDSAGGRAPGSVAPPEEILKPGRHDEWSLHSGRDLTAPEGPAWGGGMSNLGMDEKVRQIVGRQQAR
jgi:hypothetical protein